MITPIRKKKQKDLAVVHIEFRTRFDCTLDCLIFLENYGK